MKITEKMYLLAKEIVEEYDSENTFSLNLKESETDKCLSKGKATLYFSDQEGNLFDSDMKPIKNIEVIDPKEVKTKKEEDFSFEVRNCYLQCYSLFDDDLRPKNEKDTLAWHDTIEKLNRLDKLEFNDIVLITQAARNDIFWKKNFLSLVKLRRKDKDKIPYWKVFKEKFKFEKSKTQSMMEMHNQAKRDLGV